MLISEKKRISIIISLLTLFLIPLVSAQYFGFLDFYSLADIYQSYFEWFDFAIYYVIFGSLARLVFEKRFGESEAAVTALYNGVGVFLSIGLVLYESRVFGEPLLTAGLMGIERSWTLLAVVVIGSIALYSLLRHWTNLNRVTCGILASLPFLIWFYGLRDLPGIGLSTSLKDIFRFILLIAVGIGIIWSLLRVLFGKDWANKISSQDYISDEGIDKIKEVDPEILQPYEEEIKRLEEKLEDSEGQVKELEEKMKEVAEKMRETESPEEKERLRNVGEKLRKTWQKLIDEKNWSKSRISQIYSWAKQKYKENKERRGQQEVERISDKIKLINQSVEGLSDMLPRINILLGQAIRLLGQEPRKDELENRGVNTRAIMRIVPRLRKINRTKYTELKELAPNLGRIDIDINERLKVCDKLKDSLSEILKALKRLRRKRRVLKLIDKEIIRPYIGREYARITLDVRQAHNITKFTLERVEEVKKDLLPMYKEGSN